jgi:CDP-glycerol glycerophosphotransferase (TagB/SpsB family)
MHERERDYLSLHFPASEINRKFILTGCVTHQRCLYQRDMIASHGKSFIDKEKRALGLPLDRPIILVCSHWRYKSIFAKWGASLVLKLAEQLPNMLIVQNFHPLCRLITNKSKHHDGAVSRFIAATSKDSEILAQGLNRALCHPNVYVFDGLDNSRLLSVCDALITDHSSVAIEFAVFNKPIFIHDETEFSDKLSEMLYNQASERFQSLQELEKKLENLESRSDENIIQGRAAMRDAFVSSISRTATKNIASAVIRQYQSDRLAAD